MRVAKAQTSLRIRGIASALSKSVKPDISEFALFTTRLQIYVPRLRYMRRSACAHPTVLSAPLFLEQNIKHFVGPDLGPNCLLKIGLSQPLWGEGGLGPALLIVSAADKGTG